MAPEVLAYQGRGKVTVTLDWAVDVSLPVAEDGVSAARFDHARRWAPAGAFVAWLYVVLLPGLGSSDPDIPWQLATGELSFRRMALGQFGPPTRDMWSWTAKGQAWHPNGWGFDLILASFYRLGGWAGVAALRAILLGVLFCWLWQMSARATARPSGRVAAVVLCGYLLTPFTATRPQLFSFIFALGAFRGAELLMDRPALRYWHLVAWAGGFAIWASIHGAVVAGVAIVVAVGVGYAAKAGFATEDIERAAVVALSAAAGSCCGIYGPTVWPYALATRGQSQVIQEWQHWSPSSPRSILFAAVALVSLAIACRHRDWTKAVVLCVTGVLAFDALRNEPFLLIFGVGPLAALFSIPSPNRAFAYGRRAVSLGLAVLLVGTFASRGPVNNALSGLDPAVVPVAQIDALPSGCRLLNSYELGGWVILLRPDIAVSQDPRNDVYGSATVLTQLHVLLGYPSAMAWVSQHHANCVLAPPDYGLLTDLKKAGWTEISSGKAAETWVAGSHV